jgi:hypothetical protein
MKMSDLQEKQIDPVEFLGFKASESELRAVDSQLSERERNYEAARAASYRMEQFLLMQNSDHSRDHGVAVAIVDDMVAAGAGYDARGGWHAPDEDEMPDQDYTVGDSHAAANTSRRPAVTFLDWRVAGITLLCSIPLWAAIAYAVHQFSRP